METFDPGIVRKIHQLFKSRGLRLAAAESCTAGLVTHMLTTEAGASGFFDATLICYSSDSLKRLLGLKESFIEKHGTASEETARAMAEAARERTGADVALAVAGDLEPVEGEGALLVYIAASTERETTSRGFAFEGPAEEARQAAAAEALHFLYEAASVWT